VTAMGQTVKAMAIIARPGDGALLVSEHTRDKDGPFHRPLGGHVEYGERALDTIHREILEEIGQPLTEVRLLSVIENIFTWNGSLQHEVVFAFSAGFADAAAYRIAEQHIRDETGPPTRVIWRAPGTVSPPLYPEGVAGLVAAPSH
jgi:ADP-ribose pyrophosphatase YjhB (NUDIX family)